MCLQNLVEFIDLLRSLNLDFIVEDNCIIVNILDRDEVDSCKSFCFDCSLT